MSYIEGNRKPLTMILHPIKPTLEENPAFINHPDCQEYLPMSIDYYKIIGYLPPWIQYFVEKKGEWVGSGGFKGKPIDGKVEIAYVTFEQYRQQGVGAQICKNLVTLSLKTDPQVRITARTLPEHNFSTRILEKNGFELLGIVEDKDDGEVWEWEYHPMG